jgi:uncharacterized protein YrzB (UPF0473 family)
MSDQEVEKVIIPDENGEEEVFEVLFKFDVDQTRKQYVMLVPENGDEEEVDDVYAFRYEEDGDSITLYLIEDDEEWNIVESTFQTIVEDEQLRGG